MVLNLEDILALTFKFIVSLDDLLQQKAFSARLKSAVDSTTTTRKQLLDSQKMKGRTMRLNDHLLKSDEGEWKVCLVTFQVVPPLCQCFH